MNLLKELVRTVYVGGSHCISMITAVERDRDPARADCGDMSRMRRYQPIEILEIRVVYWKIQESAECIFLISGKSLAVFV